MQLINNTRVKIEDYLFVERVLKKSLALSFKIIFYVYKMR